MNQHYAIIKIITDLFGLSLDEKRGKKLNKVLCIDNLKFRLDSKQFNCKWIMPR